MQQTVEYYRDGNLLGSSQVTAATTLVDIAASIKTFLDAGPNPMNSFKCNFTSHSAVARPGIREIVIPPVIEVIVPADTMVPEYRQFTVGNLDATIRANNPGRQFNALPNVRVDIEENTCGLGKYRQGRGITFRGSPPTQFPGTTTFPGTFNLPPTVPFPGTTFGRPPTVPFPGTTFPPPVAGFPVTTVPYIGGTGTATFGLPTIKGTIVRPPVSPTRSPNLRIPVPM